MPRVFHPFAPYVGLRYVRARTHKFFVSFITWVSLLGVGLGVAALIVILSVMNGFEGELRDSTAGTERPCPRGPGTRGTRLPTRPSWEVAAARLRSQPGVHGRGAVRGSPGAGGASPDMMPVVLRGIDPAHRALRSATSPRCLRAGSLKDLVPGADHVLVGQGIARQFGIASGDALTC